MQVVPAKNSEAVEANKLAMAKLTGAFLEDVDVRVDQAEISGMDNETKKAAKRRQAFNMHRKQEKETCRKLQQQAEMEQRKEVRLLT